jgi:hypothetical protein
MLARTGFVPDQDRGLADIEHEIRETLSVEPDRVCGERGHFGSWLCKNALPEVSKRHDLVALREPCVGFG